MEQLTCKRLVLNIRALEGHTIHTIAQRIANKIEEVNEVSIVRDSTKTSNPSSVAIEHVWNTYDYLWKHCQITHYDFDNISPGNLHKGPGGVSRIILAILRCADPEQIEVFKQGRRTGIRLRQQPTQSHGSANAR